MKLISKSLDGYTIHKVYEGPRTPYERLLGRLELGQTTQAKLAAIYHGLNPVVLLRQINNNLEQLWKLADRSTRSVTPIMRQ